MNLSEEIESNKVYRLVFEHSTYEEHCSKIMDGLIEVRREVQDVEIYSINRKFFNGERAIKTCEDVLGFETTLCAVFRPTYGQNNRGIYGQSTG